VTANLQEGAVLTKRLGQTSRGMSLNEGKVEWKENALNQKKEGEGRWSKGYH